MSSFSTTSRLARKAVIEVEQPPGQVLEMQPGSLPAEESGETFLVQHVIRLVSRHTLLQEAETERVDCADERGTQPIQRFGPEPLGHPG